MNNEKIIEFHGKRKMFEVFKGNALLIENGRECIMESCQGLIISQGKIFKKNIVAGISEHALVEGSVRKICEGSVVSFL